MKISRVFNALMALFLVAAAMANARPASAQRTLPVVSNASDGVEFVPGEVIVSFKEGASATAYKAQASALAGEVSAQVVGMNANTALLSVPEDVDVDALAAELASRPGVKSASLNYVGHIPELQAASGSVSALRQSGTTFRSLGGVPTRVDKAALAGLRTKSGTQAVPTYPVEWQYADTFGWDKINANYQAFDDRMKQTVAKTSG